MQKKSPVVIAPKGEMKRVRETINGRTGQVITRKEEEPKKK